MPRRSLLTSRQLAHELDTTYTQVCSWARHGCPYVDGTSPAGRACRLFDRKAVERWLADQVALRPQSRRRREPASNPASTALSEARLRLSIARAHVQELKAGVASGELVPAVRVRQALSETGYALRQRLRALPNKVSRAQAGRLKLAIAELDLTPDERTLVLALVDHRQLKVELAQGIDATLREVIDNLTHGSPCARCGAVEDDG